VATQQDPLGEIHSLMQFRHLMTQGIYLRQKLGILHRPGPAPQAIRQSLSYRAD